MSSAFARIARTFAALAILAVVGPMAGCGPSGPKLFPLSGKVTLDGAPLSPKDGETAFVEFTADADAGNTSKHLPRGTIGADGTFTVSTANQPGLEAGAWLARVVYQREPGADSKTPYAPPVPLVAQKYTTFPESGFRVTAGPGNTTAPDFVVTK